MIRWPSRSLPKQTQQELDRYQQAIDALTKYEEQVERAAKSFGAYNVKGNKTFDAVKNVLTQMCSGARRCGYCEDSAADEIEHIKPRSLYPEATFVWLNYLYACGPCNTCKTNKFAVFAASTGKLVDVQRKPPAPVLPPAPGTPVLIDPRIEDPSHFLWLDLQSTFYFSPRLGIDSIERERAQYTIETLKLNEREYLPQSRREAFRDYRAHLKVYRTERTGGASAPKLRAIEDDIRAHRHPTVWSEMKRQHRAIRSLKKLFDDVPEALRW